MKGCIGGAFLLLVLFLILGRAEMKRAGGDIDKAPVIGAMDRAFNAIPETIIPEPEQHIDTAGNLPASVPFEPEPVGTFLLGLLWGIPVSVVVAYVIWRGILGGTTKPAEKAWRDRR